MFKKLMISVVVASALSLAGCASVPMASMEKDAAAKSFSAKPNKSNIYLYRNETFGAAIKVPVVLDGKAVGDTASKTYLLLEVDPGDHKMVSKGENDSLLSLQTVPGKNYFVWQEIKMGMFAPRTALQLVDDAVGQAGVAECKLIEGSNY